MYHQNRPGRKSGRIPFAAGLHNISFMDKTHLCLQRFESWPNSRRQRQKYDKPVTNTHTHTHTQRERERESLNCLSSLTNPLYYHPEKHSPSIKDTCSYPRLPRRQQTFSFVLCSLTADSTVRGRGSWNRLRLCSSRS